MDKPLSLRIEEVKKELVNVINSSQLHSYILDTIIKDIYQEVHLMYQKQLEQEQKEYEEKLKESTDNE